MEFKKGKILVVDDSESILFLLDSILSIHFEVVCVERAKQALEIVDQSFDTIIIDLMMPEVSGIEFIRNFRSKPEFQHIPIIVLTAKHNTEEDIAKLFELGTNDYINKPFLSAELIARVKTHSKIKLLTDSLIEANEKLRYSATHDELTKVFNRTAILDFLDNDILRLKRTKGNIILMMFDIDFFKKINDIYGHLTGDFVLRRVIELIKEIVREIDFIRRYGGDEFLIILPDTNLNRATKIANRILKRISKEDFKTNKTSFKVTISLGLSEYINNEQCNKFLERVDVALYDAKNSGRNCVIIK